MRPARPETDAGSVVAPPPARLRLLPWDLKPRPPPDALDPLGVHLPTCGPEQGRDPPLAISAILAGQADDRRRQCRLLIPTTGSLGGLWRWVERLAGTSTGPSLGDSHILAGQADDRRRQCRLLIPTTGSLSD